MKSSSNLLLENQLCFALYSTSLAMNKAYQPLLKQLGLTYSQYLVMLVLWEHEKMTVSEMGRLLFLDSGTLTPLLKRLEQAQLVKRERSSEDERQVFVSLTHAGKKLKDKAREIPEKMFCAFATTENAVKQMTLELKSLREQLMKS